MVVLTWDSAAGRFRASASTTDPGRPMAVEWCLGGPLLFRGLPRHYFVSGGYIGFVVEFGTWKALAVGPHQCRLPLSYKGDKSCSSILGKGLP